MKLSLFCMLLFSGIAHSYVSQVINTYVCSQPVEIGPCHGSEPQFYYDVEQKDCDLFLYSGCGGNDNRFEDLATCQKVCMGKKLSSKQNVHVDKSVTTPSSRRKDDDDDDYDSNEEEDNDDLEIEIDGENVVSTLQKTAFDITNETSTTVINNISQTEL